MQGISVATECNFRLRGIRAPNPSRSGAPADAGQGWGSNAGEGKGGPSTKKFSISLYFKGLRRKNREKAGRKPTKRKAKAGEKQGGFGPRIRPAAFSIRRAGPPRFDAASQAGARRRGDADMQHGSSSAICDCRTPGLPLAGPGWMGGREGNAFSPAFRSGGDIGKIIVHPLPNVKYKMRTSITRRSPPWIPAFAGMTGGGGARRGQSARRSSSAGAGAVSAIAASAMRPAFWRTARSIATATSGFSVRNCRAFSRPWPMRWSP